MRNTVIAVAVTAALGVFAGTTSAQQPANSNSQKPSQTPDQGVDDDKTPPGQARKGPADRSTAQVPVAVHSNGVAVAELDEAFDEALVVRINPDGSRTYVEVQGLERATDEVHRASTPAPPTPVLEEK